MSKQKLLKGKARTDLIEELFQRYGKKRTFFQKLTYWRKKYSWMIIVEGTKFLKRLLDIIFSLFFLIFLSPLFALIAIAIKGFEGSPILYVTTRVGRYGKEFLFPKFRTMTIYADEIKPKLKKLNIHQDERRFKIINDPRVTSLGYFLRKSSLDELPQLWTILKGDMSLVGPRPPLPQEVKHYSVLERQRLLIKPGLTCFWQVEGRSEIPFSEQVQLDIKYIESQSFWVDCKILLKTIPAVLFGKGAY